MLRIDPLVLPTQLDSEESEDEQEEETKVDAKRKWDKYTPEYDEDDNEYGTNLTSG
jgi:hypothetical protein